MRRAILALCLASTPLLAQAPLRLTPQDVETLRDAAPTPEAAPEPSRAAPRSRKFDPAQAQLQWHDRRWRLVAGEMVIKDFGPMEQDARRSLALLRDLRLDEIASIGSGMEFWLANGRAPTATPRPGLRTVAFDPAALRVEKFRGQWTVRDEMRILSAFGDSEADAQSALATIQRYRFSSAALIGLGVPTMVVFLAAPGDSGLPTPTHALKGERFPRLAKNPDGTPKTKMPQGMAGTERMASATVPAPVTPGKITRESPFWHSHGKKKPEPAAVEGRIPFDWRRVEMKNEDGEWRLASGSAVLARFADQGTAQRALTALRYYRITEEWGLRSDVAGRWLVAATNAPRGVMLGLNADTIDPNKLEVVKAGEKWGLGDSKAVALPMGDRREDAAQLLEILKRNRIDRVARFGPAGAEGVALLMRSK